MNRIVILISVTLLSLTGCVKTGRTEFVTLVQNHRQLASETNASLIRSVQDEMTLKISRATEEGTVVDPEEMAALEDLINRLEVIKRQSELIDDYVISTQVDSDLIADMVRQRWRVQ